jgi:crossover junction endodeoxyribonuclease RuvC
VVRNYFQARRSAVRVAIVSTRSPLPRARAVESRSTKMLAAVEAGCEVVEYTPAEVKRAVVGYGRAEKPQVQMMVKLLLGLAAPPSPHDAADALAVAICHLHSVPKGGLKARLEADAKADAGPRRARTPRSWRQYRPPAAG